MDDTPELWINSLGMKFRLVQPGSFQMGSPKTESRRFADETLRSVKITTRFYLSLYLTTQAEWRAVLGENPSKYSENKKAPVESVSWLDCARFIEAVNSDEYRLELSSFLGSRWRYAFPTEAQWEYVCRAGTTTPYYWGEGVSGREGNFGKTSAIKTSETTSRFATSSRTTSEVGNYPPNPWGFYDMSGNVCEWTADFYAEYNLDHSTNPHGPSTGIEHAARGGSWRSVPENCRSASRFNFLSTYRGDNCGLRLAIIEFPLS